MLKTSLFLLLSIITVVNVKAEKEFKEKDINPLFLNKMPEKPWWNKAWKARMPLLVTEPVGKERKRAILNFTCDFGRKVNPDSVRLVTPWEEEIPSQVVPVSDSKMEIIFKTDLRKYQNKPFFIYFDNSSAKESKTHSHLTLTEHEKGIEIANEKIQALFSIDDARSGKIKTIHITGSEILNQLTETSTGATWAGFDLGKINFSKKPKIKVNGPFKKTLVYISEKLNLEFTIYSFSPRIDFKLYPKTIKAINTVTKWTAGGEDAFDTFFYEGLKGPMSFKAGPDRKSDRNDSYPNKILTKWIREGWAALRDRKTNETVGMFWDKEAMKSFRYYSQSLNGGETFYINFKLKKPLTGALVATKGDWENFRDNYISWKNPPKIHLGKIQAYNKIGYKRPDLVNGFSRSYLFHLDRREGKKYSDDFAEWIVRNIQRLGGNSAKALLTFIRSVPLSKKEYNTFKKLRKKHYKGKYPLKGYDEEVIKNSSLRALVKAAHEKGVSVRLWDHGLFYHWATPNFPNVNILLKDESFRDFIITLQKVYAKTGVDLAGSTNLVGNEWACPPPQYSKMSDDFWTKSGEWFNENKLFVDFGKRVYKEIKKDYPNLPVNTLCSTDGTLRKLQFMDEKAPYLDTVENEFCPGLIPNMPALKYGIKRMHGIFGNDGRTIQHHFYYYDPNPLWRVSEMELPMIFGIKSFCHESLNHNINNPELNEITADFYRLTDYTSLDEFMAGCTPHKFMAILRDGNEVKNDIRNNRLALFPAEYSLHEARCKQLTILKNLPMDVVFNRFFKKDEFSKYKLLFIPSDRSFKDEYVKELTEYVKDGGLVIAEGNVADNKLFAELAGVKKVNDTEHKAVIHSIPVTAPLGVKADGAEVYREDSKGHPAVFIHQSGEGKVIYTPYVLTDDLNNSRSKELFVRDLICAAAGKGPIVPPERLVPLMDSSLLANGDGEYFFGVYNPAAENRLKAEIALDIPTNGKLFLLNVKTGQREPFNGKVKVDIAPRQTGFYIIGKEKTTATPELKKASVAGGYSDNPGMNFLKKKEQGFKFIFTKPGKPKVLGVLNIHDKRGRQSQAWGAPAIYNCLKKNLKDVKVIYLENLLNETINGCDAVIVPNMGVDMPYQLHAGWWTRIADFAKQGGGVMLIHHAIGIGKVGEPAFPSIGKWSGMYYPVHDFKVTRVHPVTKDMKPGDIFHDDCWDYDQVSPGENGVVIAEGIREEGIPTAALVAGKYGKGNVVISGIGIGSGYKKENGKAVKYDAEPEGGLKKILINSAKWFLEKSGN